jgi:hypothetical protein
MEHQAGCLCGAVRYLAKSKLRDVVYCHCGQCRRQTGLYYAATAVDKVDFTLTLDRGLVWYAASSHAERGFCRTCGSALFWRAHSADHIAILVGSLDDPSGLTASMHICTEGRPDFYAICDGLPQHPHSAPGLDIAAS